MSSKGRSCFEKHFLYSNPLVQLILGISPYYNSNNKFFLFITVNVFLLPLIVHEVNQLFIVDFSSDIYLDILQSMLAALCILCIYCSVNIHNVEVQSVTLHIKYDYEQLSNEDEFNILEEYNKQTKTYTYCFVVIFHLYFVGIIAPCILNIILYYVGALENGHLTLPLPINKVLDPGILYYSLFIYQTIAVYIFLILGSVCFPSYLSFVQHACCQLSIIRWKINEPFQKNKRSNKTIGWNEKPENEFDWVVDIIKRYTRVTEFVELINSCSKIGYLIIISLMMFLIVFGFIFLLQFSEKISDTSKLIERNCYIGNSIIMTYINFYVGQRLIDHNIAIFDEFRQIPFYKLSIKTRKLLVFVIARSLRPCELSIGNLFASSHQVFSGLIQKAFSFATMYYNVR